MSFYSKTSLQGNLLMGHLSLGDTSDVGHFFYVSHDMSPDQMFCCNYDIIENTAQIILSMEFMAKDLYA